jgi:hypothetical protein
MLPAPASLFASLVVGSIGLGLFIYGKKQARWPQLLVGVAMMVYPYFVSTFSSIVSIGLLLGIALWWAIRLGW